MSRARDLADLVSSGAVSAAGILADGAISTTEVTGVTVSATEINHLQNVSSNIQTQFSDVQTQLNGFPTTGRVISLATALG